MKELLPAVGANKPIQSLAAGAAMPLQVAVTVLPRGIVVGLSVSVGPTTSSSAIVTVAALGEPTVSEALGLTVTVTVSLPSLRVSCIGVTVIVAEADPAGITTFPDN